MAHATRFDLSRLEGCTGTLAQRRNGVPEETSRTAPAANAAPEPLAPGALRSSEAAPQEPEETPGTAAFPRTDAAPASAARSLTPQPAPTRPANRLRAAEQAANDPATDEDACETLPLTTIFALTLAAWIPVLWLMRDWVAR